MNDDEKPIAQLEGAGNDFIRDICPKNFYFLTFLGRFIKKTIKILERQKLLVIRTN